MRFLFHDKENTCKFSFHNKKTKCTHINSDILQPDGTVEPFMDSLVRTQAISNVFSVQLCGIGYIKPNPNKTVGGSVVNIWH